MSKMIWRDDDIGFETKGGRFQQFHSVHETFKRYRVHHTIAVICRGLEKNKQLLDYIVKDPLIIPQFHCLDHLRYAGLPVSVLESQFGEGIEIFEHCFGKKPTVFYPPWNEMSESLIEVAGEFGLKPSNEKISLSQYLRVMGHVDEDTINFHYWNKNDQKKIERALVIHNNLKPKR